MQIAMIALGLAIWITYPFFKDILGYAQNDKLDVYEKYVELCKKRK